MTTSEKVIKNKLGLLELSQQLGNVSRACKIMGYSRDSFLPLQGAVRTGRRACIAGDIAPQARDQEPRGGTYRERRRADGV